MKVIGKGNRERMVPIGESAKVVLLHYLVRRSTILSTGDWLFITTLGMKLNEDKARERLRMWARKADIESIWVSPHSLQFTFVRKWLQSGGDSLVLQRIFSHSSPAMTSYYARLFVSDPKDAHKRHSPIDALAPTLGLPRKRIQ